MCLSFLNLYIAFNIKINIHLRKFTYLLKVFHFFSKPYITFDFNQQKVGRKCFLNELKKC